MVSVNVLVPQQEISALYKDFLPYFICWLCRAFPTNESKVKMPSDLNSWQKLEFSIFRRFAFDNISMFHTVLYKCELISVIRLYQLKQDNFYLLYLFRQDRFDNAGTLLSSRRRCSIKMFLRSCYFNRYRLFNSSAKSRSNMAFRLVWLCSRFTSTPSWMDISRLALVVRCRS